MSTTSPAEASERAVNQEVLGRLFLEARTHNDWTAEPVSKETLLELWSVARWAPTSFNSNPVRVVFVTSEEGKGRLVPHLSAKNRAKTQSAPCCAIVAYDSEFYEELDRLVPEFDLRAVFRENTGISLEVAVRDSSMQGGYLILAARALGLDVGPMSGFDKDGLDQEFFPDGRWKSNFLLNLGYGSGQNIRPRKPRLDFDEACRWA